MYINKIILLDFNTLSAPCYSSFGLVIHSFANISKTLEKVELDIFNKWNKRRPTLEEKQCTNMHKAGTTGN